MIPASTTITAEGRRLRRILFALAGLVVLANLGALAWEKLTESEVVSGPNGSTYVTNGNGAAAFSDLLQQMGQPIERRRRAVGNGDLDSSTTFAVLEPGWATFGRAEIVELVRFVEDGGRLLVTGFARPELLVAVLGFDPEWAPEGMTRVELIAPTIGSPDIAAVGLSGFGSFDRPGPALPLIGGEGRVSGILARAGRGMVVALADGSIFANDHIGEDDNALLAVALTGGRRVVFDEYRHGFGGNGLLGSLPGRWPVVLWLLGGTLLAALVVYGRRLGPPEPTARQLPPERVRYVEAVAGLLARTGRPADAVRPVMLAAHHLLVQRSGTDDESRMRESAARLGLTQEETDAILSDPGGEEAALLAGSSLSKLARAERELT